MFFKNAETLDIGVCVCGGGGCYPKKKGKTVVFVLFTK